jgi:stage II sporulation protein AA (anti-sigma F factor antagonist)
MTIPVSNNEPAGYSVLLVGAKLNVVTVSDVRKAAERVFSTGIKNLILDFSKTVFLDSAGIGCVLAIQKQFGAANGKVFLVSILQNISTVLNSSSVSKILTIMPSRAAAEAVLNSGLEKRDLGFFSLFALPADFNLTLLKPLRDSIEESKKKGYVHMVFDCSRCRIITSVGLGFIVNLQKDLTGRGGGLYLLKVSDDVKSVLQDTNILPVVPAYGTLDEIEQKILPKQLS